MYIVSDFLWQICVVVLVILSKLTVDFSDKWLKLVCIWKKDKCKTIYYSFYQRELIIKIAVCPLFCVPLCPFVLISVVNMWKSRNVSRSLSFYIWKIASFFFFLSLQCDICWTSLPCHHPAAVIAVFTLWLNRLCVRLTLWCRLPLLDRFLL